MEPSQGRVRPSPAPLPGFVLKPQGKPRLNKVNAQREQTIQREQAVPAAQTSETPSFLSRMGAATSRSFTWFGDTVGYYYNVTVASYTSNVDESKVATMYKLMYNEILPADVEGIKAAAAGLKTNDIDARRELIKNKLAIAEQIRSSNK